MEELMMPDQKNKGFSVYFILANVLWRLPLRNLSYSQSKKAVFVTPYTSLLPIYHPHSEFNIATRQLNKIPYLLDKSRKPQFILPTWYQQICRKFLGYGKKFILTKFNLSLNNTLPYNPIVQLLYNFLQVLCEMEENQIL